ncbi:MAG TPA: hypothetical protein VMF13_17150, partial [Luteitalea sp.]|nr:hypothetical protein [Luteitalea sp.]
TVTDLGSDDEFSPWRTAARGLLVRMERPWQRWQDRSEFMLRDMDSGCVRSAAAYSETPYHSGVLLPSLARPLSAATSVLSLPARGCSLDGKRIALDLVQRRWHEPVSRAVSLEFTVPTVVGPPSTMHWNR